MIVFRKLVIAMPSVLFILVSTSITQPVNPQVLYDVWRELKQATGNKTIIAISPGHNATPGSGSSTLPGINYNRTTYSAHIVPAGFLI